MSTVVAIDGPAGAGKSTVAKLLADKLGITYVNTGSLYRAVAWALDQQNLAVEELTADFLEKLSLEYVNGSLLVNGNDPGAALRTAEIAAGASKVSKLQIVRDHLLPVQREAARRGWIVMEGRDIGTVIFPDAKCKFFITASLEARAKRRLAQQGEVSGNATLEDVMRDIAARDEQDSKREIAPLKAAEDAVVIDTGDMTPDQVVDAMAAEVLKVM
ncbi:MAG: (d)CMP kinase [Lentisphaerae bacterium]|nr:(d)CMP kinase [Lentisphaerota bacterium]